MSTIDRFEPDPALTAAATRPVVNRRESPIPHVACPTRTSWVAGSPPRRPAASA